MEGIFCVSLKLFTCVLTVPAIVLLDPLPFTRVISSTDHGQHKDATHSRMKIVRLNALNAQEAQTHSVEEWATRQRPLSTQAARPESARSSLASGVDTTTDESLLPAGLPDTHSGKTQHLLLQTHSSAALHIRLRRTHTFRICIKFVSSWLFAKRVICEP